MKNMKPMELYVNKKQYSDFSPDFDPTSADPKVVKKNLAIWLDHFYSIGGRVWSVDYSNYHHKHPIYKYDFFNRFWWIRQNPELFDTMHQIRDIFWSDVNQTENILSVCKERGVDLDEAGLHRLFDAHHNLHCVYFCLFKIDLWFKPIVCFRTGLTGNNPNTKQLETYDGIVVMNGSGRYFQNHFWNDIEPVIYYQYPGDPDFNEHQKQVVGYTGDSIIEECNTAEKFWQHQSFIVDLERRTRIEWPEHKPWLDENETFLVFSDQTEKHNTVTRDWVNRCVEIRDLCLQDKVQLGKYTVDLTIRANIKETL